MQDCVRVAGSPIGRKPREPISPPLLGVFCTQRVCLQSLNVILAPGPSFSVLEVGMHATSPVLHASSPSSSLSGMLGFSNLLLVCPGLKRKQRQQQPQNPAQAEQKPLCLL